MKHWIPISQYHEAINAPDMIANRKGYGGPQPKEVERMIVDHRQAIADAAEWLKREKQRLHDADQDREQAFRKVASI